MKHPVSFKKMDRDISPNLTQPGSYFEAVNGRIISNDSQTAFSFSNEKGNSKIVELPNIINETLNFRIEASDSTLLYNQTYTLTELSSLPSITSAKIIAFSEVRDRLIVISQQSTYYQFWELVDDELKLLYYNDFNAVPYENLIIQPRYESDDIQKLYFTDTNNFWHLNIYSGNNLSESINTPINLVNVFPDIDLENPKLEEMLPGGSFSAGSVQYAYNLYSKSGSETKISAFSKPLYVSNMYLGLDDIESSSQAFRMTIDNIPDDFNIINIYRIFYNDLTSLPEVSLIIEDTFENNSYSFIDDNNLQESDSTLEKILFLGSDEFIPKDIKTKDNILFPANIKYKDYNPTFDARAYAFNNDLTPKAFITDSTLGNIVINNLNQTIPETHDCINPSVKAEVGDTDYNVYRYQADGTTLGVEGPNVKMSFTVNERVGYTTLGSSVTPNENSYANNFSITNAFGNMSFKRDEVYRFFIRFKNKKGKSSFSKWIADVRMPSYKEEGFTLSDKTTSLKVYDLGVSVTVNNIPSDAESWEILREVRRESDKTIKAQGLLNSTLVIPEGLENETKLVPNPFLRGYHDDTRAGVGSPLTFLDGLGKSIANARTSSATTTARIDNFGEVNDNNASSYQMIDYVLDFYSPEILNKRYQFRTSNTDYINLIGGLLLDDSVKFSQREANTTAGATPATDFEDLTTGQNDSIVNRAFHQWQGSEGQVFTPGASINNSPDVYYINSYITAAFTHDCNSIKKVDIQGDSRFIPKSSDRGSKLYTWNAGVSNTSYLLDNASLTFKDSNDNNFSYGSFVNDRLSFNIGQFSNGNTTGLGALLTDGGTNNDLIMTRTNKPKLILADYKQVIQNQYGGNTYEARQLNNPVVISDSVRGNNTRVIYGGDTFVSIWNFMRQQMYQGYYRRTTSRENIIIPIETSVNLDLRHDQEEYVNVGKYQTTFNDYELPNDVYNRTQSYPRGVLKPLIYKPQLKFDNRVLASDVKINGELKDSWLQFRENVYIDIDGSHGPINSLQEDRDQLFAFQTEGIAQLIINPNVQITDGIALELGRGGLLHDYQYLTTSSGTINQYSVIKTPYGIMYYDALNSKLNMLSGAEKPISDLKGMNSYFRNQVDFDLIAVDKPNNNNGITGYYDHELKETHVSFLQGADSFELIYSHLLDSFHFNYDFVSNQYINNQNKIYSLDSNQTSIYQSKIGNYGEYYDEYKKTYITFIVNPSHINSVFDTLNFNSNVKNSDSDVFNETISRIRVFNEHQDTGFVNVNSIRKFREWKVNIPREENSRNRIMSQYVYVTLEFQNGSNKEFNLQNIVVNFRPQTTDYQ